MRLGGTRPRKDRRCEWVTGGWRGVREPAAGAVERPRAPGDRLAGSGGSGRRDPALRADEALPAPDDIETFLREGKIIKSAPVGKGVTSPERLTLQLGDITHDAAFQSVDEERDRIRFKSGREEINFRDYFGYNIAAYRLARLLGYDDLVPVSIERRWRGDTGALTWWVDKKWDEDERLKANIAPPNQAEWEKQVYVARVFTALVEDTDRNLGNQLVTADFHIWLIDFTRAFRRSRTLDKPAIMRKIDRNLFNRLRTLSDREITPRCASTSMPRSSARCWRVERPSSSTSRRSSPSAARTTSFFDTRLAASVQPTRLEEWFMSPVVHEAINRQINAELSASYTYLAMSAFCARRAFKDARTGCGCRARRSTVTR